MMSVFLFLFFFFSMSSGHYTPSIASTPRSLVFFPSPTPYNRPKFLHSFSSMLMVSSFFCPSLTSFLRSPRPLSSSSSVLILSSLISLSPIPIRFQTPFRSSPLVLFASSLETPHGGAQNLTSSSTSTSPPPPSPSPSSSFRHQRSALFLQTPFPKTSFFTLYRASRSLQSQSLYRQHPQPLRTSSALLSRPSLLSLSPTTPLARLHSRRLVFSRSPQSAPSASLSSSPAAATAGASVSEYRGGASTSSASSADSEPRYPSFSLASSRNVSKEEEEERGGGDVPLQRPLGTDQVSEEEEEASLSLPSSERKEGPGPRLPQYREEDEEADERPPGSVGGSGEKERGGQDKQKFATGAVAGPPSASLHRPRVLSPEEFSSSSSSRSTPSSSTGRLSEGYLERARPLTAEEENSSATEEADEFQRSAVGTMAWRCSGDSNEDLVNQLRRGGVIRSDRVYEAMRSIDRGNFIRVCPYMDSPQPLGVSTATISAPHMHASALEALKDQLIPGNRALDVGSGSGYLTVCMAHMVGVKGAGKEGRRGGGGGGEEEEEEKGRQQTHPQKEGVAIGIDYLPGLVKYSVDKVSAAYPGLLKNPNFQLLVGDGWKGVPEEAPYNAIHVGAAATSIPKALIDQLAIGGKMVIPVETTIDGKILIEGEEEEKGAERRQSYGFLGSVFGSFGGGQTFVAVTKDDEGKVHVKKLMGVVYVPLVRQTENEKK